MSNDPNGSFEFGSYRLNAAKRLLTRYSESLVRTQRMTFAFGSSGAAVACCQDRPDMGAKQIRRGRGRAGLPQRARQHYL